MSLILRLAVGSQRSFIMHLLSLGFLVSLVSGAKALENLLDEALPPAQISAPGRIFVGEVLKDARVMFTIWGFPVWAVILLAIYLFSLQGSRELEFTVSLLRRLGASRVKTTSVLWLRFWLLLLMGWLVGWASGLIAAQMAFRISAYTYGSPYEVPVLKMVDLGWIGLWTLLTSFLGGVVVIVKAGKAVSTEK